MSGRVAVTGALGFIGRAVSQRFAADGWQVVGVDRAPGEGVVAGDITTPGAWQDALAGCDVVVHTAAVVSNALSHDETWRVNTLGSRNVARAADGARLVHLSSVRAYSDWHYPDGVTEDHPLRPDDNAYTDTKVAGEHAVLQAHAEGLVDACIVRPGDVYGSGCRPWIREPLDLIRRRQFMLPAMGRGIFSPIHVDDICEGILLAATRPEAGGQVFTLGAGVAVPCAEFFAHHHRWLGVRGPLCVPTPVALALATAAEGAARAAGRRTEVNPSTIRLLTRRGGYSIEKARRVLGFDPRVSLTEGMDRTERELRVAGVL